MTVPSVEETAAWYKRVLEWVGHLADINGLRLTFIELRGGVEA